MAPFGILPYGEKHGDEAELKRLRWSNEYDCISHPFCLHTILTTSSARDVTIDNDVTSHICVEMLNAVAMPAPKCELFGILRNHFGCVKLALNAEIRSLIRQPGGHRLRFEAGPCCVMCCVSVNGLASDRE